MAEYVSPMYYRDWALPLNGGFITLSPGATVTHNLPLYTASIPAGATVSTLTLYIYVDLPDGGVLRVSFGSVSQDIDRTGYVKLVIPGASVPQTVKDGFENASYVMLPIGFQNVSSSTLRFCVMHYLPLLRYTSSDTPAPYYHGTDPYGSPGNYQDVYSMPGYVCWATRFSYRGVRTAFPFVVISQSLAQLYASTATQLLQPRLSVSGTGVKTLYSQILRWMRMSRRDGVYKDTYWGSA